MPITRTYGCNECGHFIELTLTMDQVDDGPPDCPHCAVATVQEFRPVAIGGSARGRATDLAQAIAREDYGVADMQRDHRLESVPKIRYRDQGTALQAAAWGATGGMLEQAVAIGRETRLRHGSGLDILQNALKSGDQPDLIENSKRRSMRVW
jgi:predicted nucleic acid-binding Zn ribbon protein